MFIFILKQYYGHLQRKNTRSPSITWCMEGITGTNLRQDSAPWSMQSYGHIWEWQMRSSNAMQAAPSSFATPPDTKGFPQLFLWNSGDFSRKLWTLSFELCTFPWDFFREVETLEYNGISSFFCDRLVRSGPLMKTCWLEGRLFSTRFWVLKVENQYKFCRVRVLPTSRLQEQFMTWSWSSAIRISMSHCITVFLHDVCKMYELLATSALYLCSNHALLWVIKLHFEWMKTLPGISVLVCRVCSSFF